ncbi:hypothetical protein B296_00013707 [Ensete ventricosum]|uniref:Uncharacterized protein n=1 Tax=Ensete ventricosum TaxID=4639 RepID=A0A426YJU2_ENSVE|nr:hypothetical protein B296_00013707 [Ensete ventricosum]
MGHREQRLVESRYHMDSIGGWGILLKSLLWLVETGEREDEDSGGDEWLLCGDVAVSATCVVLAVGSHYLRPCGCSFSPLFHCIAMADLLLFFQHHLTSWRMHLATMSCLLMWSLRSHTMTDAGVAWALIRMMERPTAGEKVGDKHPEK